MEIYTVCMKKSSAALENKSDWKQKKCKTYKSVKKSWNSSLFPNLKHFLIPPSGRIIREQDHQRHNQRRPGRGRPPLAPEHPGLRRQAPQGHAQAGRPGLVREREVSSVQKDPNYSIKIYICSVSAMHTRAGSESCTKRGRLIQIYAK